MTESQIKAGDIVQLKTGGPNMTVRWCEKEYETLNCGCDWFDKNGEAKSAKFAAAQLRKVSADS